MLSMCCKPLSYTLPAHTQILYELLFSFLIQTVRRIKILQCVLKSPDFAQARQGGCWKWFLSEGSFLLLHPFKFNQSPGLEHRCGHGRRPEARRGDLRAPLGGCSLRGVNLLCVTSVVYFELSGIFMCPRLSDWFIVTDLLCYIKSHCLKMFSAHFTGRILTSLSGFFLFIALCLIKSRLLSAF